MTLRDEVRKFTAQFELLSRGDGILIAVSGGPDSVAMLHLLRDLQEEFSLHLEVAHLQHGIRGEEARGDARFVAELAQRLDLPFHLKELNIPQLKASAGKGNVESLAREARHRFFADIVRERELNKVATAHTQDDQAETMLMWLLRGAGMKGLGGMSPLHRIHVAGVSSSDTLTIIRPLLNISKADVLDYLGGNKLPYRIDRTNRDTTLLRNWIRHELVPVIKQRAGEDFSVRLSREAELLREEDRYLNGLAMQTLTTIRAANGLHRPALLREAGALRRRILRLWIAEVRGHLRGLEFIHIEELLRLIEHGPPQGRLAIPGGWELVREYETLRLEKRSRGVSRVCYSYNFEPGTTLRISEAGLEIHSEYASTPPKRFHSGIMEAVFDRKCLSGTLVFRNFRHGDRIQPLGMGGHKKVKELFIEGKVPLSIRATWPILAMGAEVLWVPGYARSEVGRVSESTTAVLQVKAMSFIS